MADPHTSQGRVTAVRANVVDVRFAPPLPLAHRVTSREIFATGIKAIDLLTAPSTCCEAQTLLAQDDKLGGRA
jgi:F0F1-type ATP synthase beta subunit